MSYTELQSKNVKGRKQYYCEWCNEKILKGELHFYRAYIFDNDFNSGRQHLECVKAMGRSKSCDLEDGFQAGDSRRGMSIEESANADDAERLVKENLKIYPKIGSDFKVDGIKFSGNECFVDISYRPVQSVLEITIPLGAIIKEDKFVKGLEDYPLHGEPNDGTIPE